MVDPKGADMKPPRSFIPLWRPINLSEV